MTSTGPRSASLSRLVLAVVGVLALLGLTAGRASALPVGTITTEAGTGAAALGPWPGLGTNGALNNPHGVAYDPLGASVFISDTNNCQVVEESVATGHVIQVVNGSGLCGPPAAPGTAAINAPLDHPFGLAIDQGINLLYIADRDNHGIEVINLAASPPVLMSFIALQASTSFSLPVGLSVDQKTHDLYVADQGLDVVWRLSLGGPASIFAGINNTPGFNGNGIPATGAKLNGPSGVDFVPGGTVFIADTGNNEVRYVSGGLIHDFIGSPAAVAGFSPDGCSGACLITAPSAVRVDGAGAVFFDEDGFNLVREVNAAVLTTDAGGGSTSFPYTGNPATSVVLNSPQGLTFVPDTAATADLWFSDTSNNVVDAITGMAAASTFSSSPRITGPNSGFAVVGQAASFTVTTSGSPTPKIKAKGKLPKGLKFHNNGDGTATISGTPTSTKHRSAVGLYDLTITAKFGKGHSKVVATQKWTLRITM
jgi:hypothetical protein